MKSIVDPVLQVSLPKMLTASTGMDVVFQSEVYINKNNNPYTDLFAIKSLQLAKGAGVSVEHLVKMDY